MKTNDYDPTDDVLRLTANGATDEQVRRIIAVRRRLWPLLGSWHTQERGGVLAGAFRKYGP